MATSTSTEFPISDTALRTTIQNGGGIGETDTSFEVGVVDSVPSTPFLIGVWKNQSPLRENEMEMMKVTNVPDSQTLNVERGQKGTSTQGFEDGDLVFMAISYADVFDELLKGGKKVEQVPVGTSNPVEVEPFFSKGKFNVTFESGNLGMNEIGAVLLLDCENGDATTVATARSTYVRLQSEDAVEDGFTIFVKSNGKVEMRNRTGSEITVTISSRK